MVTGQTIIKSCDGIGVPHHGLQFVDFNAILSIEISSTQLFGKIFILYVYFLYCSKIISKLLTNFFKNYFGKIFFFLPSRLSYKLFWTFGMKNVT